MSQSVHAEHEIVRDADRRSPAQQQADAKSAERRGDLDAPILERVRNVGGRLMA